MNGLRFFIAVSLTGGAMLRGQCATCHPAIAASYAKTGMARSFYRAAAIEPVRYYHTPSETWYAIEERGGSYYQRRGVSDMRAMRPRFRSRASIM